MLNVKEDPGWFTDVSSSCSTYSPLNEFSAAGYFFHPQDEDLSISYLDDAASASQIAAPDEDELFGGIPVYVPQQDHQPQQQQQDHGGISIGMQVSPNYDEPQAHEAVLLDSVVKSKIEELAEELEVPDALAVGGAADEADEMMTDVTCMTDNTEGTTRTTTTTTATTAAATMTTIQGASAQGMHPPRPQLGFFSTPVPDSLSAVRSLNIRNHLQQQQFPFSLAGWSNNNNMNNMNSHNSSSSSSNSSCFSGVTYSSSSCSSNSPRSTYWQAAPLPLLPMSAPPHPGGMPGGMAAPLTGGMAAPLAAAVDPQVQLVQLLLLCAHKVAAEDRAAARTIVAGLKRLTSAEGTPMERLAFYFAEALGARLERRANRGANAPGIRAGIPAATAAGIPAAVPGGIPAAPPSASAAPACGSLLFRGLDSDRVLAADDGGGSMLEAFGAFYDNLPIGKFDHLTMNQVILDAVERERVVHILDLHLWIGTQWPALLHALATRPGGAPRVRITAVGTSGRDLRLTGSKLRECAAALNLRLEYKELEVVNLLDDFDPARVDRAPGEAFVVNTLSRFHYLLAGDEGHDGRFARFLSQLRSLNPKVLVMAENDADHNSPDFLERFSECLKYYSAVFDAMATAAGCSPGGRTKMERLFAAPKIRNIVACDGAERVERHESMQRWVRRLEAAGFRACPLSHRAVNQAKLLLRLYYANGYTLRSERGYLVLGWRNLPLNTISAWR